MTLEKGLVDRHRLNSDDAFFRIEAFDPIDQEHWIAMRQRRHHPPDIKRHEGGAHRFIAHPAQRPCGCCWAGCAGAVTESVGIDVFSAARTSFVTSSDEPLAKVCP